MKVVRILVTVLAVASLSACNETPVPRFTSAVTADLEVKGPAPMTGYSREKFPHWIDADRDGCDTRSEIVERDAVAGTAVRNKRGCVVGAAVNDPYSGTRITEDPGPKTSVDIDHVVALGDAWKSGAAYWTDAKRRDFANDPMNLLAVSASQNRQKSDSNAASWLPANKAFRCEYVSRQVSVKKKYHLSVTPAERDAIATNSC